VLKGHPIPYRLTEAIIAECAGSSVICLAESAVGKRFRLHAHRPGPEINEPIGASERGVGLPQSPTQPAGVLGAAPETGTPLAVVRIRGVLEQRAERHECGWSDGHDAVADRICDALEKGNVLVLFDSPGGAHAGLESAVARVIDAKRKHDRLIYSYADEMIGSAAYWWAATISNEIWGPSSMIVGSIGARSAHQSVSAKLAKEGVSTTYFAWPNDGKIAFAPELPLSKLGKQRGERDVAMAGEAFASAVSRARPRLNRKAIVQLSADALPGQLAVKAGLVDGVGSLEEMVEYALEEGRRRDATMKIKKKSPVATATGSAIKSETAPARSEEENPETPEEDAAAEGGDDDGKEGGDRPPTEDSACEGCGEDLPEGVKYCPNCGQKTEAEDDEPDEGEQPEEEDEGEDEPMAEDRGGVPRAASHRDAGAVSLTSIFSLRADASQLAIRTAAKAYVELGRAVMAATGERTPTRALGGFRTIVEEAKRAADLSVEVKALRKQGQFRQRMDLLRTLAALKIPGYSPGELFVDREISPGKFTRGPAALFASVKLAELRGLVASKQKLVREGGVSTDANPFEPSQKLAEEVSDRAGIDAIQGTDEVRAIADRIDQPVDKVAESVAYFTKNPSSSKLAGVTR
jgi:ClpP class serine protease